MSLMQLSGSPIPVLRGMPQWNGSAIARGHSRRHTLGPVPVLRQGWGSPLAAQGDPGILGAIWGGIKGAVGGLISGGPVGALAGGLKGAISGGAAPKTTGQAAKGNQLQLPGAIPLMTAGPGFSAAGGMMPVFGSGGAPSKPGTVVQTSRNLGITQVDQPPSGYHLNKSGYWSNGSDLIPGAHWVAPGTVWVRNRRTNPLNPRALSRSLRRMQGFAKATKHMRSEAAKVANAVAGPKRHGACGGGCKTRKR